MSGGVDSALAAALLKEQGYEVLGVSLRLFESRGKAQTPGACCSIESVADAARTAQLLGIAHESIDARDAFTERVVMPFVEAYAKGLTPNPCILCNRTIKFPLLLAAARKAGARYIATGHYARVEREGAKARLLRALDLGKDQSYVLYALGHDELDALVLPLGGWTKPQVRERARALGLPVFNRPESQEICFVGDGQYGDLVQELMPETVRPGAIVDDTGAQVGRHEGIVRYTLGQRKGLGVFRPHPLYVTAIDATSDTVTVGPREQALRSEIMVRDINWLAERPGQRFDAQVKVRSMMTPAQAVVTLLEDGRARVEFPEPQFAPAPGQAAVFYQGELVLGGGEIT